jgi:glycosyltransferase involved in cell wall biosynthesis
MPDRRVRSEGTLSVCMIVKNEADLLARCLRSIQPVADQIIVVDTGSQDKTVEVAKNFGAKIFETEWRNDFAWARNISLDHATSTWILWLDADDVVPPESLPLITQLKQCKPDCVFGLIVRNQRPNDTGTEFVQARMFPNRPEIRFERRVHEQMMPSALRLGMVMEKREVVIEHHGYADSDTLKRKSRRNIELMLQEYDPHHPDPVTAVEIADSYQLIDEFGEAERWYRAVLAIAGAETGFPAIASQARTGLGNLFNRQNRFDLAIEELEAAVSLAPWRSDALYALAVSHDMAGQPDTAIGILRRIQALRPEPGQVGVDFRAAAIKATLRLIRILVEQNHRSDAVIEAEKALAEYPERPEIALMAGKAFLAANDLMKALRVFEKSIALSPGGPHIDSYFGLWLIYRKAGKLDALAKSMESVRPLFEGTVRYWAAVRILMGDMSTIPERFNTDELEKEQGIISRDFFASIKRFLSPPH